jgi:hypothetical protein
MGFDEIRYREGVDLRERIRALREDLIPTSERLIDRAEEYERRRSNPDAEIEDRSNWPAESPGELEQLRKTREGEADAHDRTLKALCPEHEFDPQVHDDHPCPGADCEHTESEFVIQELLAEESKQLTDDVVDESMDIDVQRQQAEASVNQGYQTVRLLQLALIDAPSEMPSAPDRTLDREVYAVGDMPDYTLEYLHDCAVALNDVGPAEVETTGNLESFGVSEESLELVREHDEEDADADGDEDRESTPTTSE